MIRINKNILLSGIVLSALVPCVALAEEKLQGTESVPVVYDTSTTSQILFPKVDEDSLFKLDGTASQQLVKPQEFWDPTKSEDDSSAGVGAAALAGSNDDAEANERLCPHYSVPGRSSYISLQQNLLTVSNTGEVRQVRTIHTERVADGFLEVHITDTRRCIYKFSADTRGDSLVLWESLIDITNNPHKSMTMNVTGESIWYDVLRVELKGTYFSLPQ